MKKQIMDLQIAAIAFTIQAIIDLDDYDILQATALRALEQRLIDNVKNTHPAFAAIHDMSEATSHLLKTALEFMRFSKWSGDEFSASISDVSDKPK